MALEDIDVTRSPHEYEIESLLAVGLRKWFVKVRKAELAEFCITRKYCCAGCYCCEKGCFEIGNQRVDVFRY